MGSIAIPASNKFTVSTKKDMAAREKPTFDARVKEYVDSPSMTHRIVAERTISAQINGNFGLYQVTADMDARKISGECSCPSDLWPCKHICALRATWDINPKSFLDFDKWLVELAEQPKANLVEAIRNMVLHSPDLLCVFGVPGFEEAENYYEE
jgi:hypothetical protein